MLALLVDWGYRSDGIPVRLFGAWTALPAGPATLAAKTGSRILPIAIRRQPDGRFEVTWRRADRRRAPATRPSSSARRRRMADALAATIADAPEQWYSFKPIWPATAAEAADLERRARLMQAGDARPGPRSAGRRPTPRDEVGAAPAGGESAVTAWAVAPDAIADRRLVARLPPARGAAGPRWPSSAGDLWYRLAPERAAQARRNLRRVCRAWPPTGRGSPAVRAAATDPRALERLVRSAFRHNARYYLEVARTPALRAARARPSGSSSRRPTSSTRRSRAGRTVIFVGLHFGAIELPALFLASAGRRRRRPDGDDRRPGPPGLVQSGPGARPGSASSGCARRVASCWRRSATGPRSGSSAIAT